MTKAKAKTKPKRKSAKASKPAAVAATAVASAAEKPAPAPDVIVTGYKAFTVDWKCRGFQYEVGKSYEVQGAIKLCSNGFHGCDVPFDCWNYYHGSMTFGRVLAVNPVYGPATDEGRDSKFVSAKITIEASLKLPEWIRAQAAKVIDLCRDAAGSLASEKRKSAAATGDSGHAAATGYSGHAAATGDRGHAAATGDSGHAAATGYRGHAAATGYRGHAAATGDSGHAAATGDSGHAAATGDSGHAAATGKHSIAASLGIEGTAQGAIGTWLVLAAYEVKGGEYVLVRVERTRVGENGIKPDTRYRLTTKGEFVEVKP